MLFSAGAQININFWELFTLNNTSSFLKISKRPLQNHIFSIIFKIPTYCKALLQRILGEAEGARSNSGAFFLLVLRRAFQLISVFHLSKSLVIENIDSMRGLSLGVRERANF